MDMKRRRDLQIAYIADQSVMEEMAKCRKILQKLNFADRSDFDGISETVKELLGKSENAWINPPFYCDYGSHIEVGKNFYANYNLTMLDVCPITIGKNAMIGPNCQFLTPLHPLDPDERNSGLEYGTPITIGDNFWAGGGVTILPGVTLGDNVVAGAGAVVTKSFGDNVVLAGNPARVIKEITIKKEKE